MATTAKTPAKPAAKAPARPAAAPLYLCGAAATDANPYGLPGVDAGPGGYALRPCGTPLPAPLPRKAAVALGAGRTSAGTLANRLHVGTARVHAVASTATGRNVRTDALWAALHAALAANADAADVHAAYMAVLAAAGCTHADAAWQCALGPLVVQLA